VTTAFNIIVGTTIRQALLAARENVLALREMAVTKDKIIAQHGDYWRQLAAEQEAVATYWEQRLRELT